jgi:Helix-turn-helix domain
MVDQVQVKEVVMYPDGRMDVKNAAAYTGLAEKTLAMMRCEGKGPKYIKRGRVFYFKEDLDSWLQVGRVVSTAQATRNAQ